MPSDALGAGRVTEKKGLIDSRTELRQAACAGAGMAFCARIRSTTGDEGERMEKEELVRKYLRLLESNCIDEAAHTELLHPVSHSKLNKQSFLIS